MADGKSHGLIVEPVVRFGGQDSEVCDAREEFSLVGRLTAHAAGKTNRDARNEQSDEA